MNADPHKKPTIAEISEQTKEMFENLGSDIIGVEIHSNDEALQEINYLVNTIKTGSEWDDIVAGLNRCMALIVGGALQYEEFVKGLPQIYSGLIHAATNTRSALVKTSCLAISLIAKELGSKIDGFGDFIGPLSKLLCNSTQFIADCTKYTILIISKHCPGRKVFQNFLSFCLKKGSQQKLVAVESLINILSNWPSESIGTNWPRLYTSLQKFLEDASPYVRTLARKAARTIEICSKQRSAEFFSKIDAKTKKLIMDEIADNPANIPRVATSTARKVRRNEDDFQFEKRTPVVGERPKTKRVSYKPVKSSTPVRVKGGNKAKQQKKNVLENDENCNKNSTENDCNISFTPFSIDTKTKKHQILMKEGEELHYLGILKDYLDTGNSAELVVSIKNIVTDLMKCLLHTNTHVIVTSLAVLHDILPAFTQSFIPNLPFIMETLLKLIANPHPRASSNAQLVLQELSSLYDTSHLLNIAVSQHHSLPLLNFISFLVRTKPLALQDTLLCEKILKASLVCNDLAEVKSKHTVSNIINSIYQVNHDAIIRYSDTLSPQDFQNFHDFVQQHIPGLILKPAKPSYPDVPQLDSLSAKDWCMKITKRIDSCSCDEWQSICTKIYSEVNNATLGNDENNDTYLRLAQYALQTKGTKDFHNILPSVFTNLSSNKKTTVRISQNILDMLINKGDYRELIEATQPFVRSTDNNVIKNAVDFEARIISTLSSFAIKPLLPVICPPIIDAYNNPNQDIMKSVVNCFVNLYRCCGNEIESQTERLTLSQRRIIDMALSKRF